MSYDREKTETDVDAFEQTLLPTRLLILIDVGHTTP
jgi:hypothetical protein